MKKILLAALFLMGCDKVCPPQETSSTPKIEVAFSPHGGCTEKVVRLIDSAQHTVFIQAYSFTSKPIGDAILRAHQRNIKIEIILDRSDEKGKSLLDEMRSSHISTFIDAKHPIAHNKVAIIDSRWTETGSYNYTKQAESNAENCLIIDDEKIAAQYLANWQVHREHSY